MPQKIRVTQTVGCSFFERLVSLEYCGNCRYHGGIERDKSDKLKFRVICNGP